MQRPADGVTVCLIVISVLLTIVCNTSLLQSRPGLGAWISCSYMAAVGQCIPVLPLQICHEAYVQTGMSIIVRSAVAEQ